MTEYVYLLLNAIQYNTMVYFIDLASLKALENGIPSHNTMLIKQLV